MALGFAAQTLWHRGYSDQALEQARHALSAAQILSHPFSLAEALRAVTFVHLFRRESQEAHAQADALLTLAREHGLADFLGIGSSLQGGALVERTALSGAREQRDAGLVQIREGLAAMRATGAEIYVPLFLGVLAQGYGQGGQAEEGLTVIAEALALVEKNEERWNEAELYRIKGTLTLQSQASQNKSEVPNTQHPRRSGSVFPQGHRNCSKAASQVTRTARGDEPGAAVAAARQERGSPTAAGGDLRLVHRRV